MTLLYESALGATIILTAAWTATALLRRGSADLRHRIWLASIIAVALLPILLAVPVRAVPQFVLPAIAVAATGQVAHVSRQFPLLAFIWIAGTTGFLARLIIGMVTMARMKPETVTTPVTWGFFKPVILLPAYMSAWTPEQRDLAMRHEQEHVKRHDWLWQMFAQFVAAIFWFHPLVWLAVLELRREAERAVDDQILASGANATDYASQLVEAARRLRGPAPVVATAMISRPDLETRVRSILDSTQRRAKASVFARIAIVLAAAALVMPFATVRAVAQDKKVYKIGDGVSQPRIISKVEPKYTEEARDAKIEGSVVLQCEITEEGTAENFLVKRSLDAGLDANAIEAVSNWRFRPGIKDGKPVRVSATIEVTFHLL